MTTATERQVRLREQYIVNTQFAVPAHAEAYFEVHVASHPLSRPTILATRDRRLYEAALVNEDANAQVDVWYVSGRPEGTKASGVLTQIRIAESES